MLRKSFEYYMRHGFGIYSLNWRVWEIVVNRVIIEIPALKEPKEQRRILYSRTSLHGWFHVYCVIYLIEPTSVFFRRWDISVSYFKRHVCGNQHYSCGKLFWRKQIIPLSGYPQVWTVLAQTHKKLSQTGTYMICTGCRNQILPTNQSLTTNTMNQKNIGWLL